jgi:hypothetical protein
LALSIILVELGLAVLVLSSGATATIAFGASLILFSVFTGWLFWIYRSNLKISCGCFGTTATVGLFSLLRNLALIGLSLVALILSFISDSLLPDSLVWLSLGLLLGLVGLVLLLKSYISVKVISGFGRWFSFIPGGETKDKVALVHRLEPVQAKPLILHGQNSPEYTNFQRQTGVIWQPKDNYVLKFEREKRWAVVLPWFAKAEHGMLVIWLQAISRRILGTTSIIFETLPAPESVTRLQILNNGSPNLVVSLSKTGQIVAGQLRPKRGLPLDLSGRDLANLAGLLDNTTRLLVFG